MVSWYIVLFNLIYNGQYPQHAMSLPTILKFVSSDKEVDFPPCSGIYSPLLEIARQCLVKQYKKRLSASELYKYTKQKYQFDNLDEIIPRSFIRKTENGDFKKEYRSDDAQSMYLI